MDFLFVCITSPRRLLWLQDVVRSLVVRWSSDLRSTFPIKVNCCVAICFLILGISNNFFLAISFVMCWYFNSYILMPNMRQMLRLRYTSSFFRKDVRITQISHSHSKILIGMARKMRYLLQFSTLASVQNLARSPIDAFPADRRV